MKKNALLRLIPDLSFLAAASTSSIFLNTNFDFGFKFIVFSLEVFFFLALSVMISFFVFKVYSRDTFSFRSKLSFPIRGYILGLGFLCIISFFYQNNIFINVDYLTNTILLEDPQNFLTYGVTAWLISFILMIFVRTWIYFYSNATRIERKSYSEKKNQKKVLVIGGAGYIGSSLVEKLLSEGFHVKVLDILFFGTEPIDKFKNHSNFSLIKADFRKVDDLVMAMQDCSNVVHLGGLVGDPACAVDEFLTTEVNLTSTKIIGLIAKAAGVKRFIFASSCSVYGEQDGLLNEDSITKPLSLYARTKIASERVLQDLASDDFSPIILRFGTVFGLSGRTRFDLVVNLLSAKAIVEKNMTVFGANQNRPFLHVSDAAKSILLALQSPANKVHNEIFNIGSNELNFNLLEVANLIQEQVPDSKITIEEKNEDARNYKVSFDKASRVLNFQHSWSLESGIEQVVNKFKSNEIHDYSLIDYSNVMHMSEEGRELLGALEYSGWEKDLLEAQV